METQDRIEAGRARRAPVEIAFPEASGVQELDLRITAGACRLKIRPATGPDAALWVGGEYYDPTGSLSLSVEREGGRVRLKVGQEFANSINLIYGVPELNLTLGSRYAFALTVEAGASGMYAELGGLPITRLEMSHGAGTTELDFDAPNPVDMSLLKLGVGAGEIKARNLANANFDEMAVGGGAASCKLDFRGTLRHDGNVNIDTAMSSVEVYIPPEMPARIVSVVVLGSPEVDEGFTNREGVYWTPAALEGRMPMLRMHNSVALGRLALRSR
jgi:hypothetical protein